MQIYNCLVLGEEEAKHTKGNLAYLVLSLYFFLDSFACPPFFSGICLTIIILYKKTCEFVFRPHQLSTKAFSSGIVPERNQSLEVMSE